MVRLPELGFAALASILAVLVFFTPACRTDRPPTEPITLSAAGLFRTYRDTPDSANKEWRGKRIAVSLSAKDYQIAGTEIHWFDSEPRTHHTIVFECDHVPPNHTYRIEITGVCRGRHFDGLERRGGIHWCIRVAGCTVTPLLP